MSSHHRDEVFRKLAIAEPLTLPMVVLLVVFAVIFALQIAVPPFRRFAEDYLAMDSQAFLGKLRLWQALTAMFLHGSPCHFIGNMAFFWFFGSLVANAWRRRDFLAFFFTCGVVASLCFWAFNGLTSAKPVKGFGASGAVMGLMIACAMVYGERTVLAFFMIPMRIKYFVAIALALDILLLVGTVEDGVGHCAHIGGAICGAAYLKVAWWRQRRQAGEARGPGKAKSRIGGLEIMDDGRR